MPARRIFHSQEMTIMTEESILILNMLREGKVTAEQADSLLRAVRETGSVPPLSPPPAPPPPSAPPTPDPAAMASMQAKLAELQAKLGELQGKLGAAQAVKTAGQAAILAGKVLDHIPRPDLDMGRINKAVDDAMRGLNSLKNDALRTARKAGRQASEEARKAAREGRKAFKFDFGSEFRQEHSDERPVNDSGEPEANETGQSVVTWSGADRLQLENNYGRIKIIGSPIATASAEATFTKTAWAETEAAARVLLQQVFLTHQVENGCCKIGIAAPLDARDRLTVDYEITVPSALPLEVTSTFGEITAHSGSGAFNAKSVSGPISVTQPVGAGTTKLTTVSGNVGISDWNLPSSVLFVETQSGAVLAESLTCASFQLSSRSGDVTVRKTQAVTHAKFESASGDVSVSGSSAGSQIQIRTQSGHAALEGLNAPQIQVETVSGDAELREVSGALTVKTVSGDVEAAGIDSPAVSLQTVSGDGRWEFTAPFSGSFAGTTVSGDLQLVLGADSDVRIEMNTTTGQIALSLPVTEAVQTEYHATGKSGAGTGSIRLQSVSGDLKLI
jgi:DUF4097 and DUF4098 domain-containing protein YvlB